MAVLDIRALRAALAPGQRLIGVDPGSRMVGVALSDVSLMLASPYASLPRGKLIVLAASLGEIVRKENAGGLVIGLARSFGSGYVGERWTSALVFVILIGILVFRPSGLLGTRMREKV